MALEDSYRKLAAMQTQVILLIPIMCFIIHITGEKNNTGLNWSSKKLRPKKIFLLSKRLFEIYIYIYNCKVITIYHICVICFIWIGYVCVCVQMCFPFVTPKGVLASLMPRGGPYSKIPQDSTLFMIFSWRRCLRE